MADEKIKKILGLLESIKKIGGEITDNIGVLEKLGTLGEEALKLKGSFDKENKTLDSLMKNELPLEFGEIYDAKKHNVDYFIKKCRERAGGGVRLQLGKLRNNRLKLKTKQSFILQMNHIR